MKKVIYISVFIILILVGVFVILKKDIIENKKEQIIQNNEINTEQINETKTQTKNIYKKNEIKNLYINNKAYESQSIPDQTDE